MAIQRRPAHGRPETVVFQATKRPAIPLMRRVRWLIRALIVTTLVLAVLGYLFVSVKLAVDLGSAPHSVSQVATQVGPRYEDVRIRSRDDGVTLRGWLFRAATPNGRSAIFVAGWGSTRVNALSIPVGHDLVAHGYDVLLYDGRGSGESDGARQTMGNLEQRDLLGAYDFMVSRHYAPHRMVLYGASMGGATVIMDAARLPEVGAIVADSAFADLRPDLDHLWTASTHLPAVTDWLGMQVAGFLDVDTGLSPASAVRADPQRAFLFFHSATDALIPVADARTLRAASANPHSELVIVAHSRGHMDTYAEEPQLYMATLYSFVDQQIAAHGG